MLAGLSPLPVARSEDGYLLPVAIAELIGDSDRDPLATTQRLLQFLDLVAADGFGAKEAVGVIHEENANYDAAGEKAEVDLVAADGVGAKEAVGVVHEECANYDAVGEKAELEEAVDEADEKDVEMASPSPADSGLGAVGAKKRSRDVKNVKVGTIVASGPRVVKSLAA